MPAPVAAAWPSGSSGRSESFLRGYAFAIIAELRRALVAVVHRDSGTRLIA